METDCVDVVCNDGGLHGELVRNRNFKEHAKEPVHWQLIQERAPREEAIEAKCPQLKMIATMPVTGRVSPAACRM